MPRLPRCIHDSTKLLCLDGRTIGLTLATTASHLSISMKGDQACCTNLC